MFNIVTSYFDKFGKRISDEDLEILRGLKYPITQQLIEGRAHLENAVLSMINSGNFEGGCMCMMLEKFTPEAYIQEALRRHISETLAPASFLTSRLAGCMGKDGIEFYDWAIPKITGTYSEYVRSEYMFTLLRVLWVEALFKVNEAPIPTLKVGPESMLEKFLEKHDGEFTKTQVEYLKALVYPTTSELIEVSYEMAEAFNQIVIKNGDEDIRYMCSIIHEHFKKNERMEENICRRIQDALKGQAYLVSALNIVNDTDVYGKMREGIQMHLQTPFR